MFIMDGCVLFLGQPLLLPNDHLLCFLYHGKVPLLSSDLFRLRFYPLHDLLHGAEVDVIDDELLLLDLTSLDVVNLGFFEQEAVRSHLVFFEGER